MNTPYVTPILQVTTETPTMKTITFNFPFTTLPGQFYMIWIPGVDEIPMSVSYIEEKQKAFTFRKVGEATQALFRLKKGGLIGIRGPHGNGVQYHGKNLLFVGGGTGIAMITPAVEYALQQGKKTTVVIGVRTKNDVFFEQRLQQTGATVVVTTDDGTYGKKGFVTDYIKTLLQTTSFDEILTCGPEQMMKQLLTISDRIPLQASLERYMKCAIGLCGQCCVGKGYRVCIDGPIFSRELLETFPEFGVFTRDASGKKIPI